MVGLAISDIINCSFSFGILPSYFKNAIVYSFLKTIFVVWVIVELSPSYNCIEDHIFDRFQSGFHCLHSTETVLVKVTSNLLVTVDRGLYSIWILLDLSSAFDTLDHNDLISRMNNFAGFSDVVLDWFISYMTNRSFSGALRGFLILCSSFVQHPKGLFWVPIYSLCTSYCNLWGKACIGMTSISNAIQITLKCVSC